MTLPSQMSFMWQSSTFSIQRLTYHFLCQQSVLSTACFRQTDNTSSLLPRRLGGVVVSVLATGPKGCRFEPSQGDGFCTLLVPYMTD
jgi:hypothetical protein